MWTKKGIAVLGGGILALLLSLLLMNHLLTLVGLALIGMVVLTKLAGSHVEEPEPSLDDEENLPDESKIALVEREMSGRRVFEETLVNVSLDITFSKKARGFVQIFDQVPPELEIVEGTNKILVEGSGTHRIEYVVRCPLMGPYSVGPVKLRFEDPLGLSFVEEEVQEMDDILVMPRVENINEVFIRSRVPKMYSGAMTIKKPGPGYDFFSLREYVHGDPIRDINWKATAKTKTLMINQHEREAISHVMIILDATASTGAGPRGSTALVRGARAAASLASYYIGRRDSVGLVVYDTSLRMISPATGQGQLMKILEALSILEPKGDMPLEAVASVGLTHLPARSPVLILSPLSEKKQEPYLILIRVITFQQ